MKALEDRILKEGSVLPGAVLKVGSFLNVQIDPAFTMEMGREIARLFAQSGASKILTIETSGIPLAFAAGVALQIPVVFAKKSRSSNLGADVYAARVQSYTHQQTYEAVVERAYLSTKDCLLLIDDFLANGEALLGLLSLASSAGAKVCGAAVAIEKAFQGGGEKIRGMGVRVESLARIASMTDHSLQFAH